MPDFLKLLPRVIGTRNEKATIYDLNAMKKARELAYMITNYNN